MKLRRLSTAHLLVLGAFVAAGATALPALAVRAAADPDPTRFPGGPYFVIGCGVSLMSNDDPIALPGKTGASHHHTFIGNRSVVASSTAASLVGGASSCEDLGDASAYWVPTLFAAGRDLPGVLRLVGVPDQARRVIDIFGFEAPKVSVHS